MGLEVWPQSLRDKYEMHEWRHASAILRTDFPAEFDDISTILDGFVLKKSQIVAPGKNKSDISTSIDTQFYARGWVEHSFDTKILVDGQTIEVPTHKVDCYRNGVAFEIEWNNKDPFYDRDLSNFRLLFDLRVVSVGVILTRCSSLQAIFNALDKGSSYGNSTTHMSKLIPRVQGGGAAGCPVLVFGISEALYDENA